MRTGCCDVVNVEAGICLQYGCVDVVEYIAGVIWVIVGIWEGWVWFLRGGEGKVSRHIGGIIAEEVVVVHCVEEGFVEIEEVVEGVCVRQDRHLTLDSVVAYDWVVDRDALKVVVCRVVGGKKCIRDVRHIETCIGLACEINAEVLHIECLYKVLPETYELFPKLDFVRYGRYTSRIADTDWLLNPDHVREIVP